MIHVRKYMGVKIDYLCHRGTVAFEERRHPFLEKMAFPWSHKRQEAQGSSRGPLVMEMEGVLRRIPQRINPHADVT
jgi:hypothetical protein